MPDSKGIKIFENFCCHICHLQAYNGFMTDSNTNPIKTQVINGEFPEINAMSAKEISQALNLAEANINAVTDAFKPELLRRIEALKDRQRRLEFVEKRRKAMDEALRKAR